MQTNYKINVLNPNFSNLGYIVAIADLKDKHDRSAPTDYHWKILKCRMIIFSSSSLLASPDKNNARQVHIVFNKIGDDYDKLNSLFLKFALAQEGPINEVTSEIFQACFEYTMTAKLAPQWNVLGSDHLINNRDFLTETGPQEGVHYRVLSNDVRTVIELRPVKIHLVRSDEDFRPGEWIRVLPSLFKATIDDYYESMPMSGKFKSYKDLRRHWKNIHGYRLPEEEGTYYTVQFWRGEPLTYPKICVLRQFPIITPVPKANEKVILKRFLGSLKSKMPLMLGAPLHITIHSDDQPFTPQQTPKVSLNDTQAVSLCTPTQHSFRTSHYNYQ